MYDGNNWDNYSQLFDFEIKILTCSFMNNLWSFWQKYLEIRKETYKKERKRGQNWIYHS